VERRLHQRPRHPPRRGGAEKKGTFTDEPQDPALGLSRGGFGSKLHVLTDGSGNVLQAIVTAGNRNECPVFGSLVGSAVRNHGRRPACLAGDKGYSSDAIRDALAGCGIRPVIPMRANEHVNDRDRWGEFDAQAYKGRNVVERCIGKLKEFRRVATRYEKLAESFLGMVSVAVAMIYLRQLL
jgi:transposase